MCAKIRVLSEQTINEIAAGEVIENPASVIKELVENSLDAGSTDITVEIRGGGRQLIRITDNGCGMMPDDALLSLERHATSKIRSSQDIFSIGTLGFRGEAVPSIAAISKFTLLTCPRVDPGQESIGTLIMVDGGKIVSTGPAAREPGTTIEVKQLFFNVPVRKKFQRSPNYDAQEIEKILTSFAMAHPEVQFHLISNEETVLKTPSYKGNQALGMRLETLLGKEVHEQMRQVSAEYETFKLDGYVGMPGLHRPNRTGQYLFINGRCVISPWISYTVKECYGTMLPTSRHPMFVLALTIPGGYVDVNVHPQKREVRFSSDLCLKTLIQSALNPVLHPTPTFGTEYSYQASSDVWKMPAWQPTPDEEETSPPAPTTRFTLPIPSSHKLPWDMEEPLPIPKPIQPTPSIQTTLQLKTHDTPTYPRIIAILNGYLLIDGPSLYNTPLQLSQPHEECALFLIDQRRAHHRVIYEQCLSANNAPHSVQPLLIPHALNITTAENHLLLNYQEMLNQTGIILQQIGPQSWVVEALPTFAGDIDIKYFIDTLLESLHHFPKQKDLFRQTLAEKFMAASGKAAMSRSNKITLEEGQMLLQSLCKCKQPLHCPQGKPTLVAFSHTELQKRFT